MGTNKITAKDLTWHHFDQISEGDLDQLQQQFKFHHLDYEDIRSETPISKMDVYKHYIFFVFHVPTIHQETGHVYGDELYVFLSKDEIVTLTRSPIESLNSFFHRIDTGTKFRNSLLSKGTSHLLYRLLMASFRDSLSIAAKLTQEVTRIEEAIESHHEKRITVDLAHARRNILFLRHIVDPQRNMLTSLSNTKRSFISEDTLVYFDDLHDVLDTIWLTSDNLKLIIDGLFDVNEALLSHKTNEIVTLLTIVSAALMVPTLIAGFYGMNVDWLPFSANPEVVSMFYLLGFVGMLVLVIAVVRRPRK
ncbi:magnesium transporter CorA family protein [Candidatus Uhrbacteria bacterium]|jgi:magnesium transporter|nr:magnesium transporter CorA family protein [Candidatus Uhrbacteria bacterium]